MPKKALATELQIRRVMVKEMEKLKNKLLSFISNAELIFYRAICSTKKEPEYLNETVTNMNMKH